jgi:hypothetical protein
MQKKQIITSMLLLVNIFFIKMPALAEWDEYARWEQALRQLPTQEALIEAKQGIERTMEKAERYDNYFGKLLVEIDQCQSKFFLSPKFQQLDIFLIPSNFGISPASFSNSILSVKSITKHGPLCSYMKPPSKTSCEAYNKKMSCAKDWLHFSGKWFSQCKDYVPKAYDRIRSSSNEPLMILPKSAAQDFEKSKFRAQLIVLYLRRENQRITDRAVNAIIKFYKWQHMHHECLQRVPKSLPALKD